MTTVKPGKQRKARYQASLHTRQKLAHVNLSPELREKYGKRSALVRTGDTVQVMRGSHAGTEGKVLSVDLKKLAVTVEGVSVSKADRTEVPRPLHPSNLMITKLEDKDEERQSALGR